MKLFEFIKQNRLYLDGATGTELIKRGFDTNKSELLNIERPEVIYDLHKSYLEAGTRLIYTNTFGANSKRIKDKRLLRRAIEAGVKIAKEAAAPYGAYVGYDVGPIGELPEPYSSLTFDDIYEYYKEQALITAPLGLDIVALETFTDTLELKAAILAFKENAPFPVLASMSFSEGGRTFTGASVFSFALIAQGTGADAIGINCSLGADKTLPLARELIKYARTPVFIKPNAGMPVYKDGKTSYDTDAETFSDHMRDIAGEGISVLGGCCGTDSEYIKKTVEKTKNIPQKAFKNVTDAVGGQSTGFFFDKCGVIGERINPTGKPLLKAALLNGDFDYVAALAEKQIAEGADILDINVGVGEGEGEKLVKAVKKIQAGLDIPLQLDTPNRKIIEPALRVLNGIGIINSVNAEDASLKEILPLAQKYGAYVVGLTLDEKGIPETAAERVILAKKIIDAAAAYGIEKRRILIDPLTLAISVGKNNALVTLETMALVKKSWARGR